MVLPFTFQPRITVVCRGQYIYPRVSIQSNFHDIVKVNSDQSDQAVKLILNNSHRFHVNLIEELLQTFHLNTQCAIIDHWMDIDQLAIFTSLSINKDTQDLTPLLI